LIVAITTRQLDAFSASNYTHNTFHLVITIEFTKKHRRIIIRTKNSFAICQIGGRWQSRNLFSTMCRCAACRRVPSSFSVTAYTKTSRTPFPWRNTCMLMIHICLSRHSDTWCMLSWTWDLYMSTLSRRCASRRHQLNPEKTEFTQCNCSVSCWQMTSALTSMVLASSQLTVFMTLQYTWTAYSTCVRTSARSYRHVFSKSQDCVISVNTVDSDVYQRLVRAQIFFMQGRLFLPRTRTLTDSKALSFLTAYKNSYTPQGSLCS